MKGSLHYLQGPVDLIWHDLVTRPLLFITTLIVYNSSFHLSPFDKCQSDNVQNENILHKLMTRFHQEEGLKQLQEKAMAS